MHHVPVKVANKIILNPHSFGVHRIVIISKLEFLLAGGYLRQIIILDLKKFLEGHDTRRYVHRHH